MEARPARLEGGLANLRKLSIDFLSSCSIQIYIEEVDVKTVLEMIHYVYTGDFTGADLNVQSVAWVADKYNLPGMMDLLCFRMTGDVEDENIADMLIAAGKNLNFFRAI